MKILVVLCEATNEPPLGVSDPRDEFPTLTLQEVKDWPALREALAQNDWGLVICSWRMSWINGLQVLSLAQQRHPPPSQPIEKSYSETDMTLGIPSLNVKAPFVGVLKSGDLWGVSWPGNSVG